MTIGARLASYLGDRLKKEVAIEWGARWKARGGEDYAAQNLITSFSCLLSYKPRGAQMFLSSPERLLVTFEVLGVPDADQLRLEELVRDELIPIEQQGG